MGEPTTTPGEQTPTPAPAAAVETTGTPAPADATPDKPPAPATPPVNQPPVEPPIRQVPPSPDAPNSEKAAFRVENKGQPTTPPATPVNDFPTTQVSELHQKLDNLTGAVEKTIQNQSKLENKQAIEQQINTDVNKFLATNPAYSELAETVKSWAKHEAYAQIPIENIFYQVAGKDNAKLGAENAKMLADKADKATTAPGQPAPQTKPESNVMNMTDKEFDAWRAAEKSKPRVIAT